MSKRTKWNDETVSALIQYVQDHDVKTAAAFYGVTKARIYQILGTKGIKMRNQPKTANTRSTVANAIGNLIEGIRNV